MEAQKKDISSDREAKGTQIKDLQQRLDETNRKNDKHFELLQEHEVQMRKLRKENTELKQIADQDRLSFEKHASDRDYVKQLEFELQIKATEYEAQLRMANETRVAKPEGKYLKESLLGVVALLMTRTLKVSRTRGR